MQCLGTTPIARDPLALAELYFAGLGSSWNNQTEAAATLSNLKPKVTRQELSRAIRASKLPTAVLSLFEEAGLWSVTARTLASLARKHGGEVLERRAQQISRAGKTSSELTDLLDGQPPVQRKRRHRKRSSPLALAAYYEEGLAEGRWTSLASAAEVSEGWRKCDFSKALAVSKLPPKVLELFKGRPLSFALGEVLLRIHKTLGATEMDARADAMLGQPRRRSTDQIVSTFVRVMPHSGVELKVRRTSRGFLFQFHLNVHSADEMILSAEELAPIIEMTMMNLRIKRQVGRR